MTTFTDNDGDLQYQGYGNQGGYGQYNPYAQNNRDLERGNGAYGEIILGRCSVMVLDLMYVSSDPQRWVP